MREKRLNSNGTSGILLVDKPAGWTSHDVVAKVRNVLYAAEKQKALAMHGSKMQGAGEHSTKLYSKRTAKEKPEPATQQIAASQNRVGGSAGKQVLAVRRPKVGHSGTLDPFATGLLVLLVGSYTKKASDFSKFDKTYVAELKLGYESSTGDPEGVISKKQNAKANMPTQEEMEKVLDKFVGQIEQVPHAFSAIKVDGQRAYKLARAGKEVKLEPRSVQIYEITDVKYDYPKLSFTTEVSSGTYIRSLAEDIGQALDTGAYLTKLRRTRIGNYKIEDAIAPEAVLLSDL